jgi:hypothetical protein
MLADKEIVPYYLALRNRYAERDQRMDEMDAVVRGDFEQTDPSLEKIVSRSPNLIQVALEDTAEAASLMPSIRVVPHKSTPTAKRMAASMERIGSGYFDAAGMELLVPQTVMDMAAFGLASWVIWPDDEQRLPIIEKRDPRTCYPEPGFRPGTPVQRCMFAREVFFSQLPDEYRQMLLSDFEPDRYETDIDVDATTKLVLVDYFDCEEIICAGLFQINAGFGNVNTEEGVFPVVFDRYEHGLKACPVIIGSRITLDGDFRGQFDQVRGVLEAHVRLMAMVMDYADQAVYSDIWVKDLIGDMPWGGGAYIELGPNGAVGRVAPAVSSLNVQNDLDRLGRRPARRRSLAEEPPR